MTWEADRFITHPQSPSLNPDISNVVIPRSDWKEFLKSFTRLHAGQTVRLETYDIQTEEDVSALEAQLQTIELDLEDEKNPRINITAMLNAKTIKHVLFLPSKMVLLLTGARSQDALQIETVHTVTTAHISPEGLGQNRVV
jgi:hypothetical protein